VLRGLAFNACDSKVLGIHPDPAANRKLGWLLGVDLQNIAITSVRGFGSNQTEIVVLGDDSGFFAFSLLAGFGFRLNHLAEDVISNESGTAFGNDLKRLD